MNPVLSNRADLVSLLIHQPVCPVLVMTYRKEKMYWSFVIVKEGDCRNGGLGVVALHKIQFMKQIDVQAATLKVFSDVSRKKKKADEEVRLKAEGQ